MTNEKDRKRSGKENGDELSLRSSSEAGPESQEEPKPRAQKGQIGFLRRQTDEIVPALCISEKTDRNGVQSVCCTWFGETILNKTAGIQGIRVGIKRGEYWPVLKDLEEAVEIERALVRNGFERVPSA